MASKQHRSCGRTHSDSTEPLRIGQISRSGRYCNLVRDYADGPAGTLKDEHNQ